MFETNEFSTLKSLQQQFIEWLVRGKRKLEAARKVGILLRTMNRWFADPDFMELYRAAARERCREGLAVLQRNSDRSAQALLDVADDIDAEPAIRVAAAKAAMESTFKAQDTIAVQEELDRLRAKFETLIKLKTPPPPPPLPFEDTPAEVRRVAAAEQAEACRLRMAWMGEIGMNAQTIDDSLRYNRPQSVDEEQQNLDMVRKLLEVEKMYPRATP
jgi:hypothetical protein